MNSFDVIARIYRIGLRFNRICWVFVGEPQVWLRLWDSHSLSFFRKALFNIQEKWTELCPDNGHCPIDLSKEESTLHAYEEENHRVTGGI